MPHLLRALPYAEDALEPVLSRETLAYHHGRHHAGYVAILNDLIEDHPLAALGLDDLVCKTWQQTGDRPVFNAAAQVWNHDFYWQCLKPDGGGAPAGVLAEALNKSFGDFKIFKEKFSAAATGEFGSGWAWLVRGADGVAIETSANAGTPMAGGKTCLLACDVWEHAYYIDYRNDRDRYIEAFWKRVNWDFVAKRLA